MQIKIATVDHSTVAIMLYKKDGLISTAKNQFTSSKVFQSPQVSILWSPELFSTQTKQPEYP
jgi:hypothetical protein